MSGCDAFREILVDVARGQGREAPGERSLREHLDVCPDCRRRFENERMLSAGLAVMAIASLAVPPPAVKSAVMAEFRRANRIVPVRRVPVKWIAWRAAAAALLATAFWAARPGPETIARHAAPSVHESLPERSLEQVRQPSHVPEPVRDTAAQTATAKHRTPAPRHRVAKIQTRPAETATETATDFYEIPYAEPLRPNERADVFRIEMPRANIAAFGLPVAGGRLDSPVTADVLVGEDGVMRAIRFIR